ncbi:hypothetical protein TNCT_17671 [Trichonephila clavata]|uniref:Uncharacterized protein n=1 Tax=Trichonephila clavata TaxID=2740835 RepID=A0A8X6L5R0_TRICU|nr:hypothetical protein TNCT_17671 [Trichonephila clavata]
MLRSVFKKYWNEGVFSGRSGRSDPVEKTELGSCDSCGSAIVTGCSYSKIAKILFTVEKILSEKLRVVVSSWLQTNE